MTTEIELPTHVLVERQALLNRRAERHGVAGDCASCWTAAPAPAVRSAPAGIRTSFATPA